MKQEQPENRLKNLQIQCLFLIKQLKQYLQKRIYRQAVHKVQKIFAKDSMHLHQVCAQIFLKILYLQNKAINKLLQRNIYKKYLYQDFHVKKLIRILNRNNFLCKSILVAKIQSKQILDDQNEGLFVREGSYSFNVFKNQISQQSFHKLSKGFCQNYLISVVGQFVNFKTYHLSINKCNALSELLTTLAQKCPKLSFKIEFATISMKMLVCRMLFEKGAFQKCLKLINKVIQNLLNLHYKIRVWHQKMQTKDISYNKKLQNLKKKKHYLKKVMKIFMIALILMIRANMKSGFENIAVEGIKIFNFVTDKADPQMSHFRKYLNPEIYIYQQYCQYRAEKFEIAKIIEPIFLPKVNELMNSLSTQKQISLKDSERNSIFQFYNEKMIEFHQVLVNKDKKKQIKRSANSQLFLSSQNCQNITQKANNIRRLQEKNKSRQTKTKGQSLQLSSSSPSQISSQKQTYDNRLSSNNVLNIEKFVVDELEKSNWAFLTQRQKSSKEVKKFDTNAHNQVRTQRDSDYDSQKLSSIQKISQKQKHLKIASSLIGGFITKNLHKSTTSQIDKKRIVKRASIKHAQQQIKSREPQKLQRQTALMAAQRLKAIQTSLFKDLKNNVELLKQKKNAKTNILNKVCYNMIDDGMFDEKHFLQKDVSESFIDYKYAQITQNANVTQQNLNQTLSPSAKNDKKDSIDYRLTNDHKNTSSSYIGCKFKDKLKHLNKKTKLQLFIDLLIKNKDYLAVKKWSQKIEYLKKKDEMKEKLRSTRKTTSINVANIPGLSPQMSFLAGNVLKYSLQEIQEFGLNSVQALQKKIKYVQKSDNENNYRLGQKSIQMLMNKLQKEKQVMVKNQRNGQRMKSSHTQRYSGKNSARKDSLMSGHSSLKKENRSQWFCKFVL